MENLIKDLNEKSKELDIDSLIESNSYIDFYFKDEWTIAYIEREYGKIKYTLNILVNKKNTYTFPEIRRDKDNINPFRMNIYSYNYLIRYVIINKDYKEMNLKSILKILESKEEEIIKNKDSQITPYQINQFLSGDIIDIINRVNTLYNQKDLNSKTMTKIIDLILNFVNFVIKVTLDNIEKVKIIINNPQYRKFIYIDKTFSIINSFDILFGSFGEFINVIDDDNSNQMDITKQIANNTYLILIKCLNDNHFDVPLYYFDIICNSYYEWFVDLIDSYKVNDIIKAYDESILHLTENELKNIKKSNLIIDINRRLTDYLFKNKNEEIYDKLNYDYVYRCLNSQILEKKIVAVNIICELISNKGKIWSFNERFEKYLIKEKNILSIFLGESVHDEVLKRTKIIFHHLANLDQIPDNIIKQLIDNKKSILIQKIISDIVSVLPIEKRNKIFNECSKGMDLSINDNIEFIKTLTDNSLNYLYLNQEEKKIIKESEPNLYGIDTLYNYIIKFNDRNPQKNNISIAIDALVHILSNPFTVKDSIIYTYLDKIFNNIKEDETHNSIVQSIKLIKRIFEECFENRISKENYLQNLNEKYDIITLFVNDLSRYINNINKGDKDFKFNNSEIYEGIYTHSINIKARLIIIFFFVKGEDMKISLELKGEEHLENLFKDFMYLQNEKCLLFDYLNSYVAFNPDKETLDYFFKVILRNTDYINLKEINEKKLLNLIITSFKRINYLNESIIYDGKKDRVKSDKIEGIDVLYEILLSNSNPNFIDIICEELTILCMYLYDYSVSFSENFWKNYINDITTKLNNCINTDNKIGINSLVDLIDCIYSSACNFQGIIPEKKDIQSAGPESELYHFYCEDRQKHEYRIKVGLKENLFNVRWRIAYYYDINVNDVVFTDLNGNKYNFIYDFYKFMDLFPYKNYSNDSNNYKCVFVKGEKNQLLKLEINPKSIIENDENIIKNFLELLTEKNKDEECKEKVWKLFNKLPNDYYIEKKIVQLFKKCDDNEVDVKELFINEIYLVAYTFLCMREYLTKNKENEKELLTYFIEHYKVDEIINEIFDNFKINTDKEVKDKNNFIIFYFLNNLLYILNKIYYIKGCKQVDEKLCEKLTSIIYDILIIEEDINNKGDAHLLEYNSAIFKKFLNKISSNKIDLEGYDNENEYEDDKSVFTNTFIFNEYENFMNEEQFSFHFKILIEILDFIKFMFNDKTNLFLQYLMNNENLFNSIFINAFIKCKNIYSQKVLFKFLYHSLFSDKNSLDLINKYLNLMFTPKNFNYILHNDKTGIYFDSISNIITRNIEEGNKYNCQNKVILFLAIDDIIDYIKKNFENSNKEMEIRASIGSKINLLSNIILLTPEETIPYILDNDIYHLFLEKCIYNKCNEKSLISHQPLCQTYSSQMAIYKLILNLIKQNPENCRNLYKKIISKLNNFHQLGFWKSDSIQNWKISYSKDIKGDFCGLKNLGATCYLNSILQMFYNIPMLRETILSIECDENFPLLYNLQILFSSLKTYECQYYNPRDFVVLNELNLNEQMDADEFYGRLIDSIEKEINSLFSKEKDKKEDNKDNKNENDDSTIDSNLKGKQLEDEEKKIDENKEIKSQEEVKIEKEKIINPYKSLFSYFFGGNYVDELSFECGHKRYNEFFYNSIQLDIKNYGNLYESLDNYIKIETMDGDNKINCDDCKAKKSCNKRQIFKNLPNILVIVLKRFEFDYDNMIKYKLNDYFQFPIELNMKDYLIEESKEKNFEYNLKGIVIHLGTSEIGHYYDLIKTENGKWYQFNDTNVKEFNEKFIPTEAFGSIELDEDFYKSYNINAKNNNNNNNAYILMYQKKNFERDFMNGDYNQNFSTKLAEPPYDKLSNINQKILDNINIEMYQYWVAKNISSIQYQYFVLELVKMDVCRYYKNMKIIDDLEYDSLFTTYLSMKKSDFFMDNQKTQQNSYVEKEPIVKEENDLIFKFFLLYFFTVLLRLKEKFYLQSYTENLKIYINNNLNYAKYILEEFSQIEVMNEYIIYSLQNIQRIICGIISQCLLKIFDEKDDNFILLFMNSIIIIINDLINKCNIEFVYVILFEILCLNSKYRIELINLKYDTYIENYYNNNREIPEEDLYKKETFNFLKSTHHILIDKSMKSEYLPHEKSTYSEELYENKHQDFIKLKRNDKFFHSIYLLLSHEKNNNSQEEIDS